MTEELGAPLGRKKSRSLPAMPKIGLGSFPIARIAFAFLVIAMAGIAMRIAMVDDPLGGRPSAQVEINSSRNSNSVAGDVAAKALPEGIAPVVTDPAAADTGPAIISTDNLPSNIEPRLPSALQELTDFGVKPDMTEETQNGPIPRVSATGETPFEAYSRASVSAGAAKGLPRIAIVVTGMGLNEAETLDAIDKLPDNVTLAFAPYGRSLQRTTAAARLGGHEMLLQVPLEPYDYPDNDPGPQTLLTGQPARANLDRLYWLMARFGGYIGIMNHMGARFTASGTDMGPIMEEVGTRGLGYLDDGSSNRSLAPALAKTNEVPFGRADTELDANPSRSAILQGLENLEKKALENGSAIGVISALPISIQLVSAWAEGLEDKGILLVPASALMAKQ